MQVGEHVTRPARFGLLVAAAALATAGCGGHAGDADDGRQTAEVVRVIDGDTLEVRATEPGPLPTGHVVDVRMLEINTVERGHCGYQRATRELKQRLGRTVELERDRELLDRYSRYLAYVYSGGELVNLTMVADGWADAVLYEPNDKHWQKIKAADDREPWPATGCDVGESLS